MSTVSGLNARAEKGKSKYVALDINSLYKGKSLENPKATVQPKHGLQSLGKVGAGRRMPPPANLPSLKSENSGNNPNISLVPSGGQGWGSATKEKGKTEESTGNQQQSSQSQPASSHSQTLQKTQSTTNTTVAPTTSKTWSSVTSNQEDGGQERTFLGQQSPFFPQEFPKLAGGDVPTEGTQKSSADTQYGPGPSLRPQTEGSWGRGTLQQHQQQQQPPGTAGGLQQNSGSGVNGPQTPTESQPLPSSQQHMREQRPYSTASRSAPVPPSSIGSGVSISGSAPTTPPVLGSGPPGPGVGGGQMGPGSALHPPPPQFRGMMPPYMYSRNTYPSGYPSNFSGIPAGPPLQTRQPYPYPENRRSQPVRPLAEEEAYQRPAAIITEKDLKGFDEILQNDTQDTWATSHGEIDYNAKLVFSDDEESPATQKKDRREEEEKLSRPHDSSKREKERERDTERNITDRERDERTRDSDWNKESNRLEKKPERDVEWNNERRDGFERDRHPAYPPRSARSGQRPPSIADDDEVWRQRRKQQSDEMNVAVERARQRRAEDEKHYEQSKQTAQEKAKAFEKNDKGGISHPFHPVDETTASGDQCEKEIKENVEDENERSRHSSESRDDKPPSRDGRERERERTQANFQGFGFSRQFQKNVPPRFQKQVEFMRQQQTQQQPPSVPTPPPPGAQSSQLYLRQPQQPPSPGQCPPPPPPPSSHQVPSSPGSHVATQAPLPMNMNYDHRWNAHPAPPPYVNQMSGMPVSKNSTRQRSNSQGSGTDSYESDRCTPDQPATYERENRERYWKDRRQVPPGPYGAWHSPVGDEGYYENSESSNRIYDQRSEFNKRFPEKEEKAFNSHGREVERCEREFDSEDYHYRNREGGPFKERPEQKHIDPFRETKEKETKSNCWSSSRDYEERVSDHFDELAETSSNKPLMKDRHDRWEKERPQRPDSRGSRTSRESLKEERHSSEWHESQSSHSLQTEREHSFSTREEKKEKSVSINWGDTPYPMESKRREYHHHPAPITPKQFESMAPPRKNLTTLKRSTTTSAPQNASDSKSDLSKEDSNKQTEVEVNVKKEKEIKEEKNEKIRSESSAKESEKKVDEKGELTNIEKMSVGREIHKEHDTEPVIDNFKKESTVSSEEKDKFGRENRDIKEKHEHTRNESGRDRRKDGRDRTGGNSRSRGGNAPVAGSGSSVGNGVSTRFDSARGRGSRGYGGPGSGFRGRSREYRRSTKAERGPRFDRQRERDKDKFDRKDKHTDDSSCSEVEDGKLGHLRQKDEDSEVSVDEASASTTESAQAEKYQGIDASHDDEKNLNTVISNSSKDDVSRNEKFQKEKRENVKRENKSYEFERSKDEKGGFAPRGEPSRRGRGSGTVFRNSRGGPRYGPSNYGPPPSKAAFGSGKPEKLEEQKNEDCCKDMQEECKTSSQQVDLSNAVVNRETSKSHSLERHQQRRPSRFEHLPPRFQKRQARRYDNFDHSLRGKGRGRSSGYQGAGNPLSNKLSQGAKENLSDVANEEWETASESSDVAERRDRRDDQKDEHKRKESKEKGNSSSRKSFSSQRPMNESNQNRRTATDSRRGGHNADRNRQRDAYGRENRSRDSGRGRSTTGGSYMSGNGGPPGSDRRLMSNTGNSSRPSSTTGQPGSVGNRNPRGGHPTTKASSFPPKNEGTAAVYRVDEIKLQDPNSVQAAINDLNNRKSLKSEAAAVSKPSKVEKEKSGSLEGYDLNNYASVVVIDDHPEVAGEDTDFLCDAEDGFQEVTSKKRHKAALDSEVKKLKKEPNARSKNGSRSRQNRLPPRFAKQRESSQTNFAKSSSIAVPVTTAWDVPDIAAVGSKQSQFCVGDSSPAPPPSVNAWEKPITHSLQTHSQNVGQISSSSSACSNNSGAAVTPTTSATMTTDMQILATASKSSSFDRSDQHDSGIDVSDQPASAASSQRSSPSNDCKIITPKSTASTGSIPSSESCSNVDVSNSDECIPSVGNNVKSKDSPEVEESKVLELPVTFSSKEPFGKGEGADMKLDFTFDSELDPLTEEKSLNNSRNGSTVTNKSTNMGRTMEVSNSSAQVGVQSPISPSADELNLKIASVKKVWENVAPMPTVLEHPQSSTVSEDNSCPTSYNSYSGNSEPSPNSYSSSVDSSSQTRKDSSVDPADMPYRDNAQLQQTCSSASLITKAVEHSVCSVKPQPVHLPQHNPMPAGPHCAGPVSPPLMSSLDTTITGIRTIPGLASSVQVAGIPAIPSPPTVLFNSSQQMPQTGLYQPLQMDSRQSQAAAVAAAMVQFSQSPHGYAPLGTYGLSHQPPPSAQLSSAFGQQSLFVQPPSAHQGQDMYPTNQYRVQPPYPQSQHATSNQVLNAQQNMASSHLLGSQLVQTRPAAAHSATAPHLQGLHGLQPVQPGSQTSYFSSSAQAQTAANFYHQPPTTLGSPMQQQPHFPSHQSYGSQSALNVLPQAAAVTQNFRNIGSHQFKAPGTVMNSMVPETSTCLRSATRSPTIDASANRNVFGVGNTTTTTINSGSVMAVPQISSPGVVGKMGQPQVNAQSTTRLAAAANKASQYAMPQSQQHYYPFGQQKFGHVQSGAVRPQVIFPGVVRNNPHPSQHAAPAANIHYPAPIQRPGAHTNATQPAPQPPPQPSKVGNRSQVGMMVTGGKLTSAQQAKLRAEAVQQTHMFFAQSKTGKHEDGVMSQEKNGMTNSAPPKLQSSVPEENQDRNVLSPVNDTKSEENQETKEGVEVATVEE